MAIKTKFYFFILTIAIFIGGFSIAKGQFNLLQPSISNQSIEFLIDWKANTYAPADYDGKAMPTYGSKITLSATPLSMVNENDYVYNWTIDLAFSPETNGQPTTDFIVRKTAGGEHSVYLEISDKKTGGTIKEYAVTIPIFSPFSVIYQKNDGGALIPLNIENAAKPGGQLNLIARPFFFNKTTSSKSLNYKWRINNKLVEGSASDPDELSVEFPKEISLGTQYNLNLLIENPFDAFQFSEKSHKITIQ